jgi:signal transduction histidine kinase
LAERRIDVSDEVSTYELSTQKEDDDSDFSRLWRSLAVLGERLAQQGFDSGRLLGRTGHEVRGLACHVLDDGRLLVIAGDKLGLWYGGTFDPQTGEPADLPWHELPRLRQKEPFHVVDLLRVIPWRGGHAVVIGTRGNGAWIAPLAAVASSGWMGEGLLSLPGSRAKVVRRLLHDRHSETLWAAVDSGLLVWSLKGEPELIQEEHLSFRITAFTIDEDENGSQKDQLYLATNRSSLHRFTRSAEGCFQVVPEALVTEKAIWRGRGAVIEWLRPLSEIRARHPDTGAWRHRYQERGIVGATLRHLVLVYDGPNPGSTTFSQARLVTGKSKILDLAVFCLPSWQSLAVATLEGRVRIFRPSGLRLPERDELAPFPEWAPENSSPTALFSGYEDVTSLPDRVYAFALPWELSEEAAHLSVVLGLGDHTVRLGSYTVRWELRRQAYEVAKSLVQRFKATDLLSRLQRIALVSVRKQEDKNGLIHVLPALGQVCESEDQWRRFRLIVWDALAHSDDDSVPTAMIQDLRRLQSLRPDQLEPLEETITLIRKYILDRRSFSEKKTDFVRLALSTDPSLEDDRLIYRSILSSRRHDFVFRHDFTPADHFGEVQAFAPLPQRAGDGTERSFDDAEPGKMRFLIGTYRRDLWLLDGTGRALRLHGSDPKWGHMQAIHVRKADVVLAFSRAGLYRAPLAGLMAPWDLIEREPRLEVEPLQTDTTGKIQALSICSIPGSRPEDSRFLWGDSTGCIHLAGPQGSRELADLRRELEPWREPRAPVVDLRSFVERAPDGTYLHLVAACTGFGSLHVLRWSEDSEPSLKVVDWVRTGSTPATSILVADCSPRQVIVTNLNGVVAGYWLLVDELPGAGQDPLRVRLALYWAYQAGEAVRSVQHLHPASMNSLRPADEPLIVIGSYDEHLHIVDLLGRHLEVIYLPGLKVDRFVTAGVRPEDGSLVEARVYACAFENLFCGLRVISRRRLLEGIDAELRALPADEREERLSRWSTYSLREGHLRHRFARQSSRYPGPGAQSALNEIRTLLRAGDSSDRSTGIMTALLRRLFQNRLPSEEPNPGEPARGLREILADPKLYLDAVKLLKELEGQLDTPGSVTSRRVQLFWIRSFLRNIEDLQMLRRWIEVGSALSERNLLTAPGKLIQHFLDHPHELIQLKALQYIERLLFGWRGVESRPLFVDESGVQFSDFDWLLDVLLHRVRIHAGLVSRHEPNPVLLQIGRLLALLLKEGHLDPFYLSHRLQDQQVPAAMDEILVDQCAAMARFTFVPKEPPAGKTEARLSQASEVLRQARDLEKLLKGKGTTEDIVERMNGILESAGGLDRTPPDPRFFTAATRYFKALIPLLRIKNLEELYELKGRWKVDNSEIEELFLSYRHLNAIPPLLDAVVHYWRRKYDDMYLDPPMAALRYEDFYALLAAWRKLKLSLAEDRDRFFNQEQLLLDRLIRHWDGILNEEQGKHLLQDLFQIVEERLRDVPEVPLNAVEAMKRVTEEEKLTFRAFSNLFTRLLLFSEPSRALFLYLRQGETKSVGSRTFQSGVSPKGFLLLGEDSDDDFSSGLNDRWSEPDRFVRLNPEDVREWLRSEEPELEWRVVPIPSASEPKESFGYYLFGWKSGSEGLERFDLHRLTWGPLLQALAFRQASFEQETMKSRLFSMVAHNLGAPVFKMRSDLGVLVRRFLEDKPEQREEKYLELLRQARHMTGIIDGILSLSEREMQVDLAEVSLVRLIYDVVRTIRKDAQGKNIEIPFPKPSPLAELESRSWTDEVKVYDILLNLLGNAVKYSPSGSRIQVDFHNTRKGFEVRVRDEGPGIPKAELGLIFRPFFRGSQAEGVPGLGLGLYISRLYAKRLNGRRCDFHGFLATS